MSTKCIDEESTGNSELDWEIFDVLCKDMNNLSEPPCPDHHLTHTLDLTTTLRSELAASTYKRDRLLHELSEVKSSLCARDTECETLRTQSARQSALIASLQSRLQAVEHRERNYQARSESTTQTLQRERKCLDDKNKVLADRVRRLECDLSSEETHREQTRAQLQDLVRRLCLCLGIDVCDTGNLTPDLVVSKAAEIVAELQRMRTKLTTTCDSLHNCETELVNTRATACGEKQRAQQQLESVQTHAQDMESRCRQSERDLQLTRERLAECESNGDKLREELRGFESRCCRLQNSIDRFQNDRLQYLRNVASIVSVPEPCETLIKDKARDIVNDNQALQMQLNSLRDQMNNEASRQREALETTNCRLRSEEAHKLTVEERLEKALHDLHEMRNEHMTLSEYLVRLSRSLAWHECTGAPAPGADTTLLAETLLERAERLSSHHDHHIHGHHDKHGWELGHHHFHSLKLRRERSCHDIPIKETTTMYTLQRRVRVLREQLQKKDLQLELLKRKVVLMEDGVKGKCLVQSERDEAICRAKRTTKHAEKTAHQLMEAKAQLAELKAQLIDSAEHKIAALERGRKVDDLQARTIELESEKNRLMTQLSNYKSRCRATIDTSVERGRRDEHTIHTIRDDVARLKSQLADTNHKLTQLQTFRTSVTRLMHLRDIPHTSLLQRLQTLCHAHQEFTLHSRRYETASPMAEHPCPRYDEHVPTATHCRPMSSSPGIIRRYEDSGLDDHFEEDFDFNKKF